MGFGRGPAHPPRRLSAPPSFRPFPSGRAPPPPPSPSFPSQFGQTALDGAKGEKHTEVVKVFENPPAVAAGQLAVQVSAEEQAEEDLLSAARDGDLATLTRLVEKGVNIDTTDSVSGAPPAAPNLHSSPSALAARRLCCPTLTAAAAPPQGGNTALMVAAMFCKLDCLDHLIAKGANLNAQDYVRRGPVLQRGGRGCVGVGSERGRLRAVAPLLRGRAVPCRRR